MHQQVVVTTDAPAALKPLLASAIQSELRMLELGLARIAARLQAFEKHPLEGSCQEAIPLPSTTFDSFPVVVRSVYPTPDLWPQTHPCFLACGVGHVGAAPSTHQDQGL